MSNNSEKILHIYWQMEIGGAEKAIYQLIHGQREYGVDCDLLVMSKSSFYGEKVRRLGAKVFELGMKNAFLSFPIKRFSDIIRNYDIVHFHETNPTLMFIASLHKNLRLYYTHRGGYFNYSFKRRVNLRLSGRIMRRSFAGLSGNTRNAANAASKLLNISPDLIDVTYNGIYISLLEPKLSRDEVLNELDDNKNDIIRIGTTANIRDWKRIDYLLKAISNVRNLNIHCYIIGDGIALEDLKKNATDLGIDDIVTFAGKKEYIADYLQILDIFILPSSDSESFGNSAVEAIGAGIPTIVMRDGGGLVEHITEGGGFIADSVDDISAIIKNLYESESLRKSVGEKGKEYIRNKYTLENMVDSYKKLYLRSLI